MPTYKGKITEDVELSFEKGARLMARMGSLGGFPETISLEHRQAINIAKAILKKFEPEALR